MAKVRVKKHDQLRPLITEVLPAETPIIFSNDGFYLRAARGGSQTVACQSILDLLITRDKSFEKRRYIPYGYRIKKTAQTYRNLGVIHPGAQWQVKEFYEHLSPLMLHYTRDSPFSIRAPKSEARTYFIKSGLSDLSKFKKSDVAEHGIDRYLKHSPSYFAYRGYSRLYKFFDSEEFVDLESKFSDFWMLDVSRCFDSIYTHTIAWAVKDKEFAKANSGGGGPSFFGDTFDRVMQSMNYGETNGIVIGPEFSRIFAEVILQAIDIRIANRLMRSHDLKCGRDYEVRRYVDDFFIFARSASSASLIYQLISEELNYYKLGVNDAKLKQYRRPFLTPKSKTILQVSERLNDFIRKISYQAKDDVRRLIPLKIYKPDRVAISFCNDVKICCAENRCEYEEVSGYLISALKNRAIRFMHSKDEQINEIGAHLFKDALSTILRSMFFLYSVAPSVTASYKLCATILMVTRFADKQLQDFSPTLKQLIHSEVQGILERTVREVPVDGFIDLESQNLLLALSDLGPDYRLPAKTVGDLFNIDREGCSYFNLVTLIYYIKDSPLYDSARDWAIGEIERKLGNLRDITSNTEQALMFLDFMACPHIDRTRKEQWLYRFYATFAKPMPCSVEDFLADFDAPWFVDWSEIDLLNMLERRELHTVY